MKTMFEISEVILPAIVAGLFTFFVTKYNYSKNRPLDKMEIAYNRIYYPLYKIITDKNLSNDLNNIIKNVINRSKLYFIKYDKYIDISTKRLYDSLCKCNKDAKKKSIYRQFSDNIYNKNSYLRRRLGYLEPNFIQVYKYSTPSIKSLMRLMVEIVVMYITIMGYGITINRFAKISNIFASIFLLTITIIVCELMWCFLRFLYYKIRK